MFLAKFEERDRFVFFVRPRRFGKSLFISMMQAYYDRREKANFEKLFGGLWLGEHPTENRNRYLVLALDFSKAGATGGHSLQECFDAYLSECFEGIVQLRRYAADPTVPTLSAGTRLHCILYQFKGTELIRLEEIAP